MSRSPAKSGKAIAMKSLKEKWLSIVTVENPPISFSPFSLVDCTMISHFSFNDFITLAFPDLAKDLDVQI